MDINTDNSQSSTLFCVFVATTDIYEKYGLYLFGVSRNLQLRLGKLNKSSPCPFRVLTLCADCIDRKLHEHLCYLFADRRFDESDFFRLTQHQLSDVVEIFSDKRKFDQRLDLLLPQK